MTERTLLDRAAVARRLGHTPGWLYRHFAELLQGGFPGPALGTGIGARWDPAAIDAWLNAKLAPPQGAAAPAPANDSLAADTAELMRRAEVMAGGVRRRRA